MMTLAGFDLDRLAPILWSQRQADATVGVCSGNAACQLLRFPFLTVVKQLIDNLFALMDIVPSVNVDFAAVCEAHALFPSNVAAKRLAPAVYHLCLPVLSGIGTLLLCAVLVYVVVPLGSKFGVHFSDAARRRAKWRALAELVVSGVKDSLKSFLKTLT